MSQQTRKQEGEMKLPPPSVNLQPLSQINRGRCNPWDPMHAPAPTPSFSRLQAQVIQVPVTAPPFTESSPLQRDSPELAHREV